MLLTFAEKQVSHTWLVREAALQKFPIGPLLKTPVLITGEGTVGFENVKFYNESKYMSEEIMTII